MRFVCNNCGTLFFVYCEFFFLSWAFLISNSMACSRNSPPRDGKQVLNLPFGYRFYPSDDQVLHYLKQKILGRELPADIIPTIDVYSHSPDELPLDQFKYGVAGEWFFFTTRLAGNRLMRDGYWSPLGLPTEVDLEDKIIGFKVTVNFYWGCLPNGTKSKWIIYEYRLNSDELGDGLADEVTKAKVQNFVACRVRNMEEFQVTTEGEQESSRSFSTDEFGFFTSSVTGGNHVGGDKSSTDDSIQGCLQG